MAVPSSAARLPQPLDPADKSAFQLTVTQGPATAEVRFPLLEAGENIATFTLSVTAEAAAAGLTILNDVERAPVLDGLAIKFWLGVVPALQAAPQFDAGIDLAIELTIVTTAVPFRTLQRSAIVTVVQL